MDPNATLARIRELQTEWQHPHSTPVSVDLLSELAAHTENLDSWLSRGGFLPDAWKNGR